MFPTPYGVSMDRTRFRTTTLASTTMGYCLKHRDTPEESKARDQKRFRKFKWEQLAHILAGSSA